jgi:CheY-like chemotaxis protein
MSTAPSALLIVESDPTQRDLIGLSVQRLGWQVYSTGNPSDAIELIKTKKPDFLVTNTYLPGMNGFELIKTLQKNNLITGIILIVISSFGFSEIVQQAKALGVQGFFVKPIDTDLLVEHLLQLQIKRNQIDNSQLE